VHVGKRDRKTGSSKSRMVSAS